MSKDELDIPEHLQPDPSEWSFNIDDALARIVTLRSHVPADAFTSRALGTEREGSGVVIRDGLVLTIGYLVTEAEAIWITAADGRVVPGHTLAVDQETGCAYYTNPEGDLFRYRPGADRAEKIEGEDMRKDYFGKYDPADSGSMGYNWRQTVWHPGEKAFYGVHGNSGYLFRFDPAATRIELLDRITSEPSRRAGMGDLFSYGYLGFTLGPDGRTLYYLTGGPVYENGKRVKGQDKVAMGMAKGIENLHLITYDIPTRGYKDHGPVFYPDGQRPTYVNSIAVGQDGSVYTLARVTENGHTRTDLVQIKVIH